MNQVRLAADSSCDLLTLSGTDFVRDRKSVV